MFPDRSLIVGAPGKAVRSLDDAAVAKLLASAAYYVANWKRFATALAPIGCPMRRAGAFRRARPLRIRPGNGRGT